MLRLGNMSPRLLRRSCIRCFSKHSKNHEEVYERLSLTDHILLRPGMYIGQMEQSHHETWIFSAELQRMEKKRPNYSPALLKIFDEIVVNAADNSERDSKMTELKISVDKEDSDLVISVFNDGKSIPVKMDPKEGMYIPALIFGHLLSGSNFDDNEARLTGGRHGYGAKLTNIFSKRFDVEVYDAKAGLLYKQRWENNMKTMQAPVIEKIKLPADYTKLVFVPDLEKFGTSLGTKSPAQASTTVKMLPIEDTLAMFYRRALDVAACIPSVEVSFNSVQLPVKSFRDYVELFAKGQFGADSINTEVVEGVEGEDDNVSLVSNEPYAFAKIGDRWEVGVLRAPSGGFESMAFVNSVWTPGGGSHVNLVTGQIVKAIEEALAKQGLKGVNATSIRNRLLVIVKCKIENPSFDSQSKDHLTSKPSAFGSDCVLPKTFLNRIVAKLGIVEEIMLDMRFRDEAQLLKASSTSARSKKSALQVDVPKLEDAHFAGDTTKALDCTLILTEGDSAKALAVSGMEVVGREYFGVLSLRGKLLNAREVSPSSLAKNTELMNICKALGLDFTQTYSAGLTGTGLRYGKVLLMCDQDNDGSHIKGLFINFIHRFWPHLLKVDGFLQQFSTPLVKARLTGGGGGGEGSDSGISASSSSGTKKRQGKKNSVSAEGNTKTFYSMAEYVAWKKELSEAAAAAGATVVVAAAEATPVESGQNGNAARATKVSKYSIKYYKGLGTSTAEEGKEYFRALDKHKKVFYPAGAADDAIDLAFNKHRAEDRRKWLTDTFDADSFIDPLQKRISYEDFINKEMIQFSYADNQRSIPSVIDGLKPSQRKVLHACFKKKLHQDMKVVQLGGYVAEQTAYHHGEASLYSTIVKMAQDFVGTNNFPLLVPSGQFGTRAQGGKDFASPRYIFTRLAPITRALFPEGDDDLLELLEEDGQPVEPRFFVPIIPTLLVNGSQGIGTGWSTSVPSFHPLELAEMVRDRARGTPRGGNMQQSAPRSTLRPWVRGFAGSISPQNTDYISSGVAVRTNDTTIEVRELPCWRWTHDYKALLCRLVDDGVIRSFREFHTTTTVKFVIKASKVAIDDMEKAGLLSALRLQATIGMGNMHAFNRHGVMTHYERPEDIVDEHFDVRLELYARRKAALRRKFAVEEALSRNRSLFVSAIINGQLTIFDPVKGGALDEAALLMQLRSQGFSTVAEIDQIGVEAESSVGHAAVTQADQGLLAIGTGAGAGLGKLDYSYLLSMPIQSLTEQKCQSLQKAFESARVNLRELESRSERDLWVSDLDALIVRIRSEMGEEGREQSSS